MYWRTGQTKQKINWCEQMKMFKKNWCEQMKIFKKTRCEQLLDMVFLQVRIGSC